MNVLEGKHFETENVISQNYLLIRGWKIEDQDVSACLISDSNHSRICNETKEISCFFDVKFWCLVICFNVSLFSRVVLKHQSQTFLISIL